MTFQTKNQICGLLSDLEVITLREDKKIGQTVRGKDKYWHVCAIAAVGPKLIP